MDNKPKISKESSRKAFAIINGFNDMIVGLSGAIVYRNITHAIELLTRMEKQIGEIKSILQGQDEG